MQHFAGNTPAAVELLNQTKRRFQSKELAQVREMLENLLETLR